MKDLVDIQQEAVRLKSLYGARDLMYEEIRQMFHMEWAQPPQGDWVKKTMSPSAFNQVMGATRLMVSTEPQISVPFDESEPDAKQASDKIEAAAKAMWTGSGRVLKRPVHYELVFSGFLFGEMCGCVSKTADLVKIAQATGHAGQARRMERLARETPYLFETYNPMQCYPDYDRLGLNGLLHKSDTTWGAVLDTWGSAAEGALNANTPRHTRVVLNDWYDWECRAVWLEQGAGAIWHGEHNLAFLPVMAAIAEGSNLFVEPERQRFPLLYAVWKSELWKRENLSLTRIFSLIFALASNPQLVYESEEGGELVIDRTIPSGIVNIRKGDRLYPLADKVLDQSQTYGLDLAERINEESTISKVALGAPPEGQLAFSAISLLTQSGRLPLMGTKNNAGALAADMLMAALEWMKADKGGKQTLYGEGGRFVELDPAEIPERLVVTVKLEPDLAQDKLQMANTAVALQRAGLVDDRWIRENILGIGQSDQVEKGLWMQRRLQLEGQLQLQQIAAAKQAAMQQSAGSQGAPAQGDGGAPGEESHPPGAPAADVYPPGGVGEGAPLAGPLQPQMPGAQ